MADKKLTEDFKAAFLAFLAEVPNITVACRVMGVHVSNVYREREKDSEFDKAIEEAKEEGYDLIEEEARRRAVEGYNEPVFYQGARVGEVRKYSDALLIHLLKAYKPKKFNPGVKIGMDEGEKVTLSINIGG
jgi:hypothetical protein